MTKTIRTLAALALVCRLVCGKLLAHPRHNAQAHVRCRFITRSSHSRPRAMRHQLHPLGRRRNLDLHHFRRRGNLERLRPQRRSQSVCSAAAPEDFTSTVSGVPRFAPGEELILFLERTPAQDFSIVSWMQGTFRIAHNRTTGEEIVTQDTAAFPVFDPASHNFETAGIRKMPLSAFRSLVTASAEPQAAQGSRQ